MCPCISIPCFKISSVFVAFICVYVCFPFGCVEVLALSSLVYLLQQPRAKLIHGGLSFLYSVDLTTFNIVFLIFSYHIYFYEAWTLRINKSIGFEENRFA